MKCIYITDPCYLISEEDWDELLHKADKEVTSEAWGKKFDEAVTNFLRNKFNDKKAVAGSTGFGDWENSINGRGFAADSGMVCVCQVTDELKHYMNDNRLEMNPLCVATMRVHDDTTYEIDQSNPRWSLVKVKTPKRLYVSEQPENEE